VSTLHRFQCVGALRRRQFALEEGVVVDGALGGVRKDGDGDALRALYRSIARTACVLLPGRNQGRRPAEIQVVV
jgi:hypothetical protein